MLIQATTCFYESTGTPLLRWSCPLHISFASKKVRAICESEEEADSELGHTVAAVLRRRLADLDAAASCGDLPPLPDLRTVKDADTPQWVAELSDGWELAFCGAHTKQPTSPDGEIDWAKVSRIKILRIGRQSG